MPKKLPKKKYSDYARKIHQRKRNVFSKRGGASFGVIAILLVIASLSFALVFGKKNLSPQPQGGPGSSYTCCDSGDGEQCTPNPDVKFKINIDSLDTRQYAGLEKVMYGLQEYRLLKTSVRLAEGSGHIVPIADNFVQDYTLKPGEHLFRSDAQRIWYSHYMDSCQKQGQVDKAIVRDSLFKAQGCAAIPDDELLYLCTSGCENATIGANAVFNVYFRQKDIDDNRGIPDVVKNCAKPSGSSGTRTRQRLVNLPHPTGQDNLQLETFYIVNEEVTANWVSPYCKPAVYLYPQEKSFVHVEVNPIRPLTYSIPAYPNGGWNVEAYPGGDIFYQNKIFDYLYYETQIPDDTLRLPDKGYVIAYASLGTFIPDLVTKLGLNKKETKQFSEYWLDVLPKVSYYQIKVVSESTLNTLAPLFIYPTPRTVIRVTLHFTPLEEKVAISEPDITTPARNGFTVVEWGGIYKRDSKHDFSCFM